jgi:hypothetical protein
MLAHHTMGIPPQGNQGDDGTLALRRNRGNSNH